MLCLPRTNLTKDNKGFIVSSLSWEKVGGGYSLVNAPHADVSFRGVMIELFSCALLHDTIIAILEFITDRSNALF